jgi:hypothetical protein
LRPVEAITVATNEQFENLVFQQKRAHKAWMSEIVKRGEKPSSTADGLVWELLLSYGEAVRGFDEAREDIYKTAYELASLVLGEHPDEGRLTDLYRDLLIDAIIDTSDEGPPCDCRTLVHFANLISTAFSEARADTLKKTIRHNRAENLSNELRVAKAIQKHLLPRVIPEIPGFEFAGRLVPAQEVGGDYWSVKYWKDDGVVTLKLADISGHGVAAATLVAAVKFISGGYYKGAANPSEVIRQTNRVLAKETPYDIMVSMVYGWLRPETRQLTIVNAGHEPVFLCREDLCIDFHPTGPVLGVTESDYTETDIQLQKNDIVFFGSDGITEAGVTEQFGIERLKELVIRNSRLSADKLADKVIQTVSDYAGQPHDDISLVVVKVTE